MKHAYQQSSFENSIAYLHGRIEAQLEAFAGSLGVPPSELTSRVAALLLALPSGSLLRTEDNMPSLRRKTTRAYKKRLSKVEVASRPSGPAPPVRKRRTSSIKSYWERMTPKERQAEMARRVAKREAGNNSLRTQTQEQRIQRGKDTSKG